MANLLTCSGFTESQGSWVASLPCMQARIGIVILFFIIAVIRKWGGEEMGLSYSFVFGLICGIVPYFLIASIFASAGWAFIVGLIGAIAGGYGFGLFMGE